MRISFREFMIELDTEGILEITSYELTEGLNEHSLLKLECLLDEDCKPLMNAIVWMDNRAGVQAEKLRAHFGDELCYQITGQVSFEACWPAAKLLWVKEHEPALFAKIRHILLVFLL